MKQNFKLWIISLIFVLVLILSPFSIYAQEESSKSATIVEKINALKEEIASKAAQLKTEITKKVQNKAIIGRIQDITDREITIETLTSAKTVKYDEFTQALGIKNKEIKIETLEEGDKIAALGDMDDKNTLVTQRIVYLDSFATASAGLVWGQIQKSQGVSMTILNKSGVSEVITTSPQTQYFLGNEEASFSDAKVEKHLVARGTRLKDGSLRAKFIYFIPSMGFLKPQKPDTSIVKGIASPSATLTKP